MTLNSTIGELLFICAIIGAIFFAIPIMRLFVFIIDCLGWIIGASIISIIKFLSRH